jgi:hypothetical protein
VKAGVWRPKELASEPSMPTERPKWPQLAICTRQPSLTFLCGVRDFLLCHRHVLRA